MYVWTRIAGQAGLTQHVLNGEGLEHYDQSNLYTPSSLEQWRGE